MKQVFFSLLLGVALFSLAGCGEGKKSPAPVMKCEPGKCGDGKCGDK